MTDLRTQIVAAAVLDASRWRPDTVVTNPFGERVWLRKCKGSITDCCDAKAPCELHAALADSTFEEADGV